MTSPLVVESTITHTASLIFLHGLGDSGYGWGPVMKQLSRSFKFMKFICPHAPNKSVTLNGGMKMPSWYDIYTLNEHDEREDEAGLRESRDSLVTLIENEQKAGIPSDRIFIGGFSQGGAVSIFTTLTQPSLKIGGIIALSSYVPCRRYFRENPPSTMPAPIFLGHGTADFVVQYRWHQHSVQYLKGINGAIIINKTYEGMDHSACEEEIEDIKEFIEARLSKSRLALEKSDL